MSVHIILGSKNDMPVAEKAVKVLEELSIPYTLDVASAHRNPEKLKQLVENSTAQVFIGIAGLSAALPGVIAAHTTKPVIGVPVSGKLNIDAVLSIVQMPKGVPVAAVGLDNGINAALLAAEMLALCDDTLQKRLATYREEHRE